MSPQTSKENAAGHDRPDTKKQKVSRKQAKKEFDNWLYGVRRVRESLISEKNPDLVESVDNCVQNVVDGVFSINSETGEITHKLAFPIGEGIADDPCTELIYAKRLSGNAMDMSRKFKNPDDNTKMRIAMATLSGKTLSYITKMEFSDITTASDLMVFYMLG